MVKGEKCMDLLILKSLSLESILSYSTHSDMRWW